MRLAIACCLSLTLSVNAIGQSPVPPLDETRLTIHTLVREDIFAGWRSNNMDRLERGAQNVDLLLEKRPEQKADLLAWKGGIALYRAVLAHEDHRPDDFQTHYGQALELFEASRQANANSVGAHSVIGGSYGMFADRLPEEVRADAWTASYESFQNLARVQADYLDKLPIHHLGELLGGLTQAAQRTGHQDVYEKYLNQIIEKLPDTPYAKTAQQWQIDPEAAKTGRLSCQTCHSDGRLSVKLKNLKAN